MLSKIYTVNEPASLETPIFISLLTFVIEVFGSRRKCTLSRQEIPQHIFEASNLKQISSLMFLTVTTVGQVKANYFTNIQGRTWRKIMQIDAKFIAERRYFHWQVVAVSFPSSSGRTSRITIAQCNLQLSEHSDYDLSVTTKRCVLKGLKVNIGDWLVSQALLLF